MGRVAKGTGGGGPSIPGRGDVSAYGGVGVDCEWGRLA